MSLGSSDRLCRKMRQWLQASSAIAQDVQTAMRLRLRGRQLLFADLGLSELVRIAAGAGVIESLCEPRGPLFLGNAGK